MTIDELLADADPAHELPAGATDPESPSARALFSRIVAGDIAEPSAPRRPAHRSAPRRIVIGGVLAGAAATILLAAPMPWDHGGPGSVTSAYGVTRDGDAVRVSVHWSELTSPQALQDELDRAGAHVKIFVRFPASWDPACLLPDNTVGYSAKAVQWTLPARDTQDSGFVVRPGYFPHGATFVVSVALAPAGSPGFSTMAPGQPRVEAISSYMVLGAVPTCAP